MLSLNQLRKIDNKLVHLTDVELEVVRDTLYQFAWLGFDLWHENKGFQKPLWESANNKK